jgi:hypothetical protein
MQLDELVSRPHRPVLIGQAPGRNMRFGARPLTGGRAGNFLRELTGLKDDADYVRRFAAINLLEYYPGQKPFGRGDLFPAGEAREAAKWLIPYLRGRQVIFVGGLVADAFGLQRMGAVQVDAHLDVSRRDDSSPQRTESLVQLRRKSAYRPRLFQGADDVNQATFDFGEQQSSEPEQPFEPVPPQPPLLKQDLMFGEWWSEHWKGMPEFVQPNAQAVRTIHVHFEKEEDIPEFAKLVGQQITATTRYIWFPYLEHERFSHMRYVTEEPAADDLEDTGGIDITNDSGVEPSEFESHPEGE